MTKKLFTSIQIMTSVYMYAQTGNVGINTPNPTNTLHIKGNGTSDPLRIENLLFAQNTAGTLVADSNGVTRLKNLNTISSVRVLGSMNLAADNTLYATNVSSTPVKNFDNLSEFSGNTFTATQAGLYLATFTIDFMQQTTGDGYLGYAVILKNGTIIESNSAKIALPENNGVPDFYSSEATVIIKLNASEQLSFQAKSYGADASAGAQYDIHITRLD
ncbi:hypothetical protein GCM10023210_33390 [Chryseobacterium ginsengisoli]|uniref:C1q domain-containing protein n=1 Tax=Chryseobacterium ginsengisoli TaxID=363853 RepID=A0ABP9MK60_9FLAO